MTRLQESRARAPELRVGESLVVWSLSQHSRGTPDLQASTSTAATLAARLATGQGTRLVAPPYGHSL